MTNHFYKSFDIIIRKNCNIKPKRWWLKNLLLIKKSLVKQLKKNLVKQGVLCLLITNDKEIKKLNKIFRKKNKPTDVLSFYLSNNSQIKYKLLGDVVISIDTAKKKAKKQKIKLEEELITLLVHGYLHLLGYNHKKKKDAKIMFKLQDKTVNELLNTN